MDDVIANLRFASDATMFVLWGAGLLLFALIAMWADLRRTKRKAIDDVGWVPWTRVFFICAIVGLVMLAMGVHGWFVPG